MNAQNTYRKCVEFEEKAASIYMQMAARFILENAELSGLWLDMALQEKQHAGLLQFCLIEGMTTPCKATPPRIGRIESELRRLESAAGDPALSIQGAFQIAVTLESSEVNDIYRYLTTPLHSSMYLLRRKVMTMTPDHVDRILREAGKYGVPVDRLKLLGRDAGGLSPWKLRV